MSSVIPAMSDDVSCIGLVPFLTGPMEHWAGWPVAPEAYLRGEHYLLGHELRHNYSQIIKYP
jgi:hypothetical protein